MLQKRTSFEWHEDLIVCTLKSQFSACLPKIKLQAHQKHKFKRNVPSYTSDMKIRTFCWCPMLRALLGAGEPREG
jgi:Sec7-like guanine-nucleotide exchange factor